MMIIIIIIIVTTIIIIMIMIIIKYNKIKQQQKHISIKWSKIYTIC